MIAKRILGVAMVIIAILSLVLSVLALVQVWTLRQPVTNALVSTVDLFSAMLDTTSDGLMTIQQSLYTTTANITYLEQTTETISRSLRETGPMVDSMAGLTGRELPTTITATQRSLNSAQSAALLIDDVLGALTNLPIAPVAPYRPAVPLHVALGEVSTSLDALPPSLATIDKSLRATSVNLSTIEQQTQEITDNIQVIQENMADIQEAIERYQEITAKLQAQIAVVRAGLPIWMTSLAWVLSFAIVWVAIAQLGLLVHGLEMLR